MACYVVIGGPCVLSTYNEWIIQMETSQLKEEHNKRVKALTDENKRIASNAEKEIEMLSQHRDEMRAKIVKLQKQMNSQTGNYESDSDASSDGGTLTLPTTTLSGSIEAMKAEEKRRLSKKYRKKVTKLLRVSGCIVSCHDMVNKGFFKSYFCSNWSLPRPPLSKETPRLILC